MATNIVLTVLGVLLVWQVVIRLFKKKFHFPAPAFIGRYLDSDLRRKLQPPDKLIERSGIKQGMRVLEVGCGSGAFVTFVARVVGSRGRVYALDIQSAMLKQLGKKLTKPENQDIKNIEVIRASAYNLPFENNSLDLAYLITVLQEIPDRQMALAEIKRVLKPGGILAVTELLPDPDYPLRSTTIRIGEKAGFVFDKASGNFWNYTVRFRKQLK